MNLQPVPYIPETFVWVTDEFRKKHNQWLENFWQSEFIELDEVKPPVVKRKRTKTKKYNLQYEHEGKTYNTLSELLDNLDKIVDFLSLDDDKQHSWLRKHDIKAFRKLGVYIPVPWLMDKSIIAVASGSPLPTMFCVGFPSELNKEQERYTAKLFVGIKQNCLPKNVEFFHGTPYVFGMCFDLDGKNLWIGMYVVVGNNGEVHLCKELVNDRKKIVHHRKSQHGRFTYISQKRYQESDFLVDDGKDDMAKRKYWTKSIFANCIHWWNARADNWSVSLNKDQHRLTFMVGGNNTKHFFADRDKTVKAVDGKAKRICHYVREHDRVTGEHVKDHVRGLRSFDWAGFACKITAPKFHAPIATAAFNLDPVAIENKKDSGFIGTVKLAKLLTAIETK